MKDNETSLEKRMDLILQQMELGQLEVDETLDSMRTEQPGVFNYIFAGDNAFLTEAEKDQLLFMSAVLWSLDQTDDVVTVDEILKTEEIIWAEAELPDFPYSSAHPLIEEVHDELFAFLIDCTDPEDADVTVAGAKWLLVKGFTMVINLQCQ